MVLLAWLVLLVAYTARLLVRLDRDGDGPAQVVNVDAWGAIADDDVDDGPALRAALHAAADRPGTNIRLGAGRYDIPLADGPEAREYLSLADARDVRLIGDGAELRFADPVTTALLVARSVGVRIEGIT